jgi:hypothetical protein
VRELRRHIDTPLETGRHRSLSLQRLWPLLQDERPESTPHQAEATPGKYLSCLAASLLTSVCMNKLVARPTSSQGRLEIARAAERLDGGMAAIERREKPYSMLFSTSDDDCSHFFAPVTTRERYVVLRKMRLPSKRRVRAYIDGGGGRGEGTSGSISISRIARGLRCARLTRGSAYS